MLRIYSFSTDDILCTISLVQPTIINHKMVELPVVVNLCMFCISSRYAYGYLKCKIINTSGNVLRVRHIIDN